MKQTKKPLQVYLEDTDFKILEKKRKELGLRSWAEVLRKLIRESK